MRLTTKGRYATTAMMDLALNGKDAKVSLQQIAQNQNISLSYLEQLFAKLRLKGLVRGTRGPGGGYALARDAADISIADVITAVDEKVDITRCHGKQNCQDGLPCITHSLWAALSDKLLDFLAGISLADMLEWPDVQRFQPGANVQVAEPEYPTYDSIINQ